LNRLDTLRICFAHAATSYRKNYTNDTITKILEVSINTLSVIPTESLEEVFNYDYENRTGLRGFPTDRDLLEAYRAIRATKRTRQEWNINSEVQFNPGVSYTWVTLPWCYKSDRLRELIAKKDNFTMEEQIEWDREYENRIFFREDLRTNESLALMQKKADNESFESVRSLTCNAIKEICNKRAL
jgi:hypothetical protein